MQYARPIIDDAMNDVDQQLRDLAALPTRELRARWTRIYGKTPRGLGRSVLLHELAYRLQEKAYGGLSRAVARQLARLQRQLESDPNASLTASPVVKPGTQLLREWRGTTHRVTVTEDGFTYRDDRYKSLSQVARKITGTRWSGPAFFGLRNAQRQNRG